MLNRLSAAIFATIVSTSASAGALQDAVELCSDPLTTGPEKLEQLPAYLWQSVTDPSTGPLVDFARSIVISFTGGMDDLEARFAAADQLAGNFAAMLETGQVTLWTRDGAILAVSLATTAEGGEHLGCYFAGPESTDIEQYWATYGPPETLPEIESIGLRFDESAMRFDPDVTYQMFSMWGRLTSDPQRTPLTDSYRLERLQQP